MLFETRTSLPRRRKKTHRNLRVEALEPRTLLACNVISGFVYNDANNNGLFDPGETPIANSTIELRNASGAVVGRTTTDASGAYRFETDNTIDTTPTSSTQSVTFAGGDAFSLDRLVNQFNPDLGTLTSVEIISQAFIQGQVEAENREAEPFDITANIEGTVTLSSPGVAALRVAEILDSETFSALVYDGIPDFAGTSGFSAAFATPPNTPVSTTLTSASDLAAYTGTGSITFTLEGLVFTSGEGAANLETRRSASAGADVTVIYRYTPSNCLSPGNYTIVQTTQPPGYNDGLESRNGVVIDGSVGTDFIPVTLGNADLPNNNFGELTIVPPPPSPPPPPPVPGPDDVRPSSLSGFVYFDANNNGAFESREFGIANVTVTLTGTDNLGQSVLLVTMTGEDGFYSFNTLRAGTYTITETQPTAFITGKDTVGTVGGVTRRNQFSEIALPAGVDGLRYNFGEISRKACKLNHFNFNAARGRALPARPGPQIRLYLPGMLKASAQGAMRRGTARRA